jgi:hypothetical protein
MLKMDSPRALESITGELWRLMRLGESGASVAGRKLLSRKLAIMNVL